MMETLYPSELASYQQYPGDEWMPPTSVCRPMASVSNSPAPYTPSLGIDSHVHHPSYEYPYNASYITPPMSLVTDASAWVTTSPSITRPRSSPSVFEHAGEDRDFGANPLRINHEHPEALGYDAPARFNVEPPTPHFSKDQFAEPRLPKWKSHINIAPDPVGVRKMKHLDRFREEEDFSDSTPKRRNMLASSNDVLDLNAEERLLLRLKDEDELSWKDIAQQFQNASGKVHRVPALQMRYKRLREKMRTWTDAEVLALQQAHKLYHSTKWDIIANIMVEKLGIEKWPPKYCSRKWEELNPGSNPCKDNADLVGSERASVESDRPSPVTPVRGTPAAKSPLSERSKHSLS